MDQTIRCPNCGAALRYSADRHELFCDHCGFAMPVEEFERQFGKGQEGTEQAESGPSGQAGTEQTEAEQAKTGQSQAETGQTGAEQAESGRGQMNMKIYHCTSCGAILETDTNTAATRCAYCGNPTLIQDRIEGRYKPDLIIPFSISKDKAMEAYEQWTGKGPLTPRQLRAKTVTERMTGIYLPFWLYDFHAEGNVSANATRTRIIPRSNGEDVYTDHFFVRRDLKSDFNHIPADASVKMDDEVMDKLEPFRMQDAKTFAPEYLAGFLAERFDQDSKAVEGRARERAKRYITQMAMNTIRGYSSVVPAGSSVDLSLIRRQYALFPVWMMNCTYQGRPFSFVMNGQTGQIVADRPISGGKAVGAAIGVFAASFALSMLGGLLF